MKSCDRFAKDAFNFWDGLLARQEHETISEHLRTCVFCEKRFAQARMLKQTLHDLPKHKTSPHFNVVLHAKLRTEANRRRGFLPLPLTGWSWQLPAYAAAALFLIAGGVVIDRILNQHPITPQNSYSAATEAETFVVPAVEKKNGATQKIKNYVMQPIPMDQLMRINRRYAANQLGSLERRPFDSSSTRASRSKSNTLPNLNQVDTRVRF